MSQLAVTFCDGACGRITCRNLPASSVPSGAQQICNADLVGVVSKFLG